MAPRYDLARRLVKGGLIRIEFDFLIRHLDMASQTVGALFLFLGVRSDVHDVLSALKFRASRHGRGTALLPLGRPGGSGDKDQQGRQGLKLRAPSGAGGKMGVRITHAA